MTMKPNPDERSAADFPSTPPRKAWHKPLLSRYDAMSAGTKQLSGPVDGGNTPTKSS